MKFRWAVIAVAVIFSVLQLFHSEQKGYFDMADWRTNLRDNIKLGLDLQGGIFMQLEVDIEDAVEQYLEEQSGSIKEYLESEDIQVGAAFAEASESVVKLQDVNANDKDVDKILRDFYGQAWFVSESNGVYSLKLKDTTKRLVQEDAVSQTVYKVQNRIDALGVTEPNINRAMGSNRIILELAGADDVERVHKIVREPGKLEWRMVVQNSQVYRTEAQARQARGGQIPPNQKLLPMVNEKGEADGFVLLEEVMLTARNVTRVFPSTDQSGFPAVGVELNREGGKKMEDITGRSVGRQMAIILDGKVISAPRIQGQFGKSFIITGSFSQREVNNMVVKIKSGSLPAEVNILEERVIGPTLGRDAIREGAFSAVLGLVLVIVFILLYYRRAGVYALFALILNLILILGLISGIGAVLTLPGIAGFILTIGMAVDANVLVFERIREELRNGAAVRAAVETGYRSAFTTILDANITTFLAGFCLLLMGEGPIKGFAVMLMIGIVCSIFTAVFCSRTFFLAYLNSHRQIRALGIWPVWQSSKVGTSN